MHIIRTAIAGILALFVASAAVAQTFPTVPSQSVIGRLGTPGTTGPSQAIPFSVLRTFVGSAVTIGGQAGPNFLLDPTLHMTGATLGVVTGTLGPTIPLNSGNNLFSGNDTFSGTNSFTGANTFSGSVTLPNQPAYSWLLNNTNAAGAPTPITVGALTLNGSPDASTTTLPCETGGVLGKCTAGSLAGSLTTGITTFGGSSGPSISLDSNTLKMTGTTQSVNTGTSGHKIPFLDGANTFTGITSISKDVTGTGENAAQLQVEGATSTSKKLAIGYDTTGNYAWMQSVNFGVISTPLALQPNGNFVGINTTAPTAPLDVNGSARVRSLTVGCVSSDASGNLSSGACGGSNAIIVNNAPYSAACNGTGDDSAAFQAAITAAQSSKQPVFFSGTCRIASGLSITSNIEFAGTGSQSSILLSSNLAAGSMIAINTTSPVYLHDFAMGYTGTASSGAVEISLNSPTSFNSGSRFERLNLTSTGNICMNLANSAYWTIVNSQIACQATGIIISNANTPDGGDSTIYGSLIQAGIGGTAIVWNSSGGLRIANNKILGNQMAYGIQIALAPGATTADIFINGNSIEGVSGDGIFLGRAGSTGGLGTVIITGNEVSGNFGLSIPTDVNGVWINNLIVTSNICVTCVTAGFSIDSVQGIVLSQNFTQPSGTGTVPIAIGTHGPTSTNCVVGPNPRLGTAAASNTGSCTAIAPN